jgi:hypothetical protein
MKVPYDKIERNYTVGDKRPPKHTQFKKGKSGNPSGKRKCDEPSKPLIEILKDVLRETITLTVGGRQKRLTRFEALAHGLVHDSLKGKTAARKQLLDFLNAGTSKSDTAFTSISAPPHNFSWTEAQEAILQNIMSELHAPDSSDDEGEETQDDTEGA